METGVGSDRLSTGTYPPNFVFATKSTEATVGVNIFVDTAVKTKETVAVTGKIFAEANEVFGPAANRTSTFSTNEGTIAHETGTVSAEDTDIVTKSGVNYFTGLSESGDHAGSDTASVTTEITHLEIGDFKHCFVISSKKTACVGKSGCKIGAGPHDHCKQQSKLWWCVPPAYVVVAADPKQPTVW